MSAAAGYRDAPEWFGFSLKVGLKHVERRVLAKFNTRRSTLGAAVSRVSLDIQITHTQPAEYAQI